MKNKFTLLALALISTILIAGCVDSDSVCNPPYIQVGDSCCLDSNNNSICDSDEVTEVPVTGNESNETPPGNECTIHADCDDEEDCTTDTCTNGYCSNTLETGCLLVLHDNVEVESKGSYWIGSTALHIVGEVKNKGESTVENIQVNAVLYDIAGKKLMNQSVDTYMDKLQVNEKSPFHLAITVQSHDFHNYELEVSYMNATTEPYTRTWVLSDNMIVNQTGFHITGKVENRGSRTVSNIKVAVTLYNNNLKVVGAESVNVLGSLGENQRKDFHVHIENVAGNVDTYTVDVQAS